MGLRDRHGRLVYPTDYHRSAFHAVFLTDSSHPFYQWYREHIVSPPRVALMLGAYHPRVGKESPLYRHFTEGWFHERRVLEMVMQMME